MANTRKADALSKKRRAFYKNHEYVHRGWSNGEYVLGKWVKKE